MDIIETRTQVWPICHVGSYDGDVLDPNYVLGVESEQESMNDEGNGDRIVSWEFDNDAWDKAVVEAAQRSFDMNEPLKDRGVKKVTVTKYYHPTQYNYITDDLYVNVEVDDVNKFVKDAYEILRKDEHKEQISKYINDHWHSRDGFLSHMSETYDEFLDDCETFLSPDDEDTHFHCLDVELFLGEVLTLLSLIDGELSRDSYDGETDITSDIRDYLSGNHTASGFFLTYNVYEEAKKHGIELPDFEAEKARIKRDVDEYVNSFGEETEQARKMHEWEKMAMKRLDDLERDLLETFDSAMDASPVTQGEKVVGYDYHTPRMDEERVKDKINEIEFELTTQLKV